MDSGLVKCFVECCLGQGHLLQVVSSHTYTESFRLKLRVSLQSWGTSNKSALSLCPQISGGRFGADCWRPKCCIYLWDLLLSSP